MGQALLAVTEIYQIKLLDDFFFTNTSFFTFSSSTCKFLAKWLLQRNALVLIYFYRKRREQPVGMQWPRNKGAGGHGPPLFLVNSVFSMQDIYPKPKN